MDDPLKGIPTMDWSKSVFARFNIGLDGRPIHPGPSIIDTRNDIPSLSEPKRGIWTSPRGGGESDGNTLETLNPPLHFEKTPPTEPATGALLESKSADTMPKPVIASFPGLTKRAESIQPRSASNVLTKADLQSTFRVNLAPSTGSVPSQSAPTAAQIGDTITAESNVSSNASETSANESPIGTTFITGMTQSGQVPSRTSSKKVRQYVLSDGSVAASGKGLGRGRPGIKRGPRKPKSEEQVSSVSNHEGAATSAPSHTVATPLLSESSADLVSGQPLQQTGKRKRNSEFSGGQQSTPTPPSMSRDSSVEYVPTTSQTRSGRSTQKPQILAVEMAVTSSPSGKKSRNLPNSTPTPIATKTHPKIKRRIYRGREQSALCEHCHRGYGPPVNVIVFCDACNKCWHQRCHDPQIPKELVANVTAEWFCADCDRILHGKKKATKNNKQPSDAMQFTQPIAPPPPATVGSNTLTKEQRKAYLQTLTKDRLLSILLQACDSSPNINLFEAPNPAMPATPQPMSASAISLPVWAPSPQVRSTYVTPVDKPNPFLPQLNNESLDEGYDDHIDEHAALYPKPGNGIKLPPDSTDLHMLLEGPDCTTFSHWVRPIMPPAASMPQPRQTVTVRA